MSKKQLVDFILWAWYMGMLKNETGINLKTLQKLVDIYMKTTINPKKIHVDLCEGCQFEHDLLSCINCDDLECQIKIKEKEKHVL